MKQSPWIERVASSSAEKRAEILAHGAGGGGERHVWKTHAPAQLRPGTPAWARCRPTAPGASS